MVLIRTPKQVAHLPKRPAMSLLEVELDVVEDIVRYVTLLRQRLAKTDDVYNMRFR